MVFSGVVSLISLSGCSNVALSSICVGSLVVLGFYLLVAPLLVGSLYWCLQLPPYLVCAKWQGEGEME